MDIPLYVSNLQSESQDQENYNQQLNLTLQENLGILGFNITPISNADLLTTPILDPDTGEETTVATLAQDGAMWFVVDHVPPVFVGKINGSLVQFVTNPYP